MPGKDIKWSVVKFSILTLRTQASSLRTVVLSVPHSLGAYFHIGEPIDRIE